MDRKDFLLMIVFGIILFLCTVFVDYISMIYKRRKDFLKELNQNPDEIISDKEFDRLYKKGIHLFFKSPWNGIILINIILILTAVIVLVKMYG